MYAARPPSTTDSILPRRRARILDAFTASEAAFATWEDILNPKAALTTRETHSTSKSTSLRQTSMYMYSSPATLGACCSAASSMSTRVRGEAKRYSARKLRGHVRSFVLQCVVLQALRFIVAKLLDGCSLLGFHTLQRFKLLGVPALEWSKPNDPAQGKTYTSCGKACHTRQRSQTAAVLPAVTAHKHDVQTHAGATRPIESHA